MDKRSARCNQSQGAKIVPLRRLSDPVLGAQKVLAIGEQVDEGRAGKQPLMGDCPVAIVGALPL
jgi:hypothetical protein